MSRVTQREVYRTVLDRKARDWARALEDGVTPTISQKEFTEIVRASELLVDARALRTKWDIAVDQGIFVRGPGKAYLVNIPGIEAATGVTLPRGGAHTHAHTSDGPTAAVRAGAHAREDCYTETTSYSDDDETEGSR